MIGHTKSGKPIYEGHEFSHYGYPGKWHKSRVMKVDEQGYHTSTHFKPIPVEDFHNKIDNEGVVPKKHKLDYYKNHSK